MADEAAHAGPYLARSVPRCLVTFHQPPSTLPHLTPPPLRPILTHSTVTAAAAQAVGQDTPRASGCGEHVSEERGGVWHLASTSTENLE